uniref:High mobility group B protein 15 n=1 Tax=Cucumis melo TaxID=3656 RepID=A0A9I9DLI4_CUCME
MASTSFAGGKQLPVIEVASNCVPYPPPQTTALPKAVIAVIAVAAHQGFSLHVIRERRWKEVTSVFNFPSTATNASFVLRKYYISLLHHFEQIYFFKAVGWTPVTSDSSPCPSASAIPTQGVTSMLPPSDNQAASHQPRSIATELPAVSLSSTSPAGGFPVIGVIDGKFDSGYLVTVTVGTEKLKGVLYQAPEQPSQPQVLQPVGAFAKDGSTPTTPNAHRRRRRKKSEIKRRDPAHPKPNRSGYNFFFAEQHARLKPLYPGKDREISRMIGDLWNKLKESERTVYQEKAMKDKERYRIEMVDYREKLRTGQIISDAVPLQQRLPEPDLNMVYGDKNEETEGGESQTPDHDTSYVEGDSGEYKTEEKDEDEEDDEEDEEEDDSEEDASPQGIGNVDVNILVEEEQCETRTGVENVRKESSTVGDKKEVLAGDSVMVEVEAKEEPEPTTAAIRED